VALKFIMIDDGFPIIFGDYFAHRDVADRLRQLGETTSAGFVGQNADGTFFAYGESIGLNLKPAESDSKVVDKVLRRYL